MALFGKRQVDAQVSDMTWSRLVQLERQQWVRKRGSWAPSEGTRNVEKHTETYWDTVTDMSYAVTFTAADKQYGAKLPGQEWRGLEPGLTRHLSLGLLGGVKKVTHAR